jgi:hypothetical protein
LDLFDILHKIDIIVERRVAGELERIVCDDDCDGDIDIFDVVREVDALLERIPTPLTCPATGEGGSLTGEQHSGASLKEKRGGKEDGPAVQLRRRGRLVSLDNADVPVRGLELTLVPEGEPVAVKKVRATRRTRRFTVDYHQVAPGEPIKVILVSLSGESVRPGKGPVMRIKTAGGGRRARLRMSEAKVAAE